MTKTALKLATFSAVALGLATQGFAEIPLTDSFSVQGHIAGSYTSMDMDPGPWSDRYDVDDALILFTYTGAPITGVASLYYVPNSDTEIDLLDGYVTYDVGGGLSITGGKYLSYLGYESFFTVNNSTITFANNDFIGAIPGYQSGLKINYSDDSVGFGASFVDSLYGNDGELKENGGAEAHVVLTGIPGFTLFGGLGYQDAPAGGSSSLVYNIWGSYEVSEKINVGAEFTGLDVNASSGDGYNWLGIVNVALTDKVSTAFRISGEKVDGGGPEFIRYTIAPGIALTEMLGVRAEYTYTDYKNFSAEKAHFFGVQAFLKF